MADVPGRPKPRRRRWVVYAAVLLLATAGAAVGVVYYLWVARDAQWSQTLRTIEEIPEAEQLASARALEDRVTEHTSNIRGQEPWTMQLRIDEANTWLAQRLRPWARSLNQPIPPQVGRTAVWTKADRIYLGTEVEINGVQQVISFGVVPSINEAGQLVLKLGSVRAGKLPVPIQALIDRLGLRTDPRYAEALPYIEQAVEGIVLEPARIDSRQVRITAIDVGEEAITLTLITEPH